MSRSVARALWVVGTHEGGVAVTQLGQASMSEMRRYGSLTYRRLRRSY